MVKGVDIFVFKHNGGRAEAIFFDKSAWTETNSAALKIIESKQVSSEHCKRRPVETDQSY